MALIDVAGAGQHRATWTNVDVALRIEDEVCSAKGAIVAGRLVPHRNVRRDAAIHQPLEQPDRAISGVAREPPRPQTKAASDTLHHGLSNSNLHDAIGTGALGIDNDSSLVVDEIVRIIGKEWVHARPGNPGRLRIDQRDFFGRLASSAGTARTTTVYVTTLLIARGIESRKVLANRVGCILCGRPAHW